MWPQEPQLLLSLLVSTQVPPQLVVPPEHWQVPFAQFMPLEQAWPQAPQLWKLAFRFISQPLAGLWSQSAKPALQVSSTQVPLEQPAVPFGKLHTCPQAPQLLTSLLVFMQVPPQAV